MRRNPDVLGTADRERAINQLKAKPQFRNLSRRLLADVVDRSSHHTLGGESWLREAGLDESAGRRSEPIQHEFEPPLLGFAVLEGTAHVRHKDALDDEPLAVLTEGGHGRFDSGLDGVEVGRLHLQAPDGEQARLVTVHADAVRGSPEVLGSLDLQDFERAHLEAKELIRRVELLWMGRVPRGKRSLQPLVHLVAGSIAESLRHPTAIVELGGTIEAAVSTDGEPFRRAHLPQEKLEREDLEALVNGYDGHGRVFVLNPPDPLHLPERLGDVRFDRVIYVTHEIPERMPAEYRKILREDLTDQSPEEPHFGSFVPSIPISPNNPPSNRRSGPFDDRDMPDDPHAPPPAGTRPNRDSARIRVDGPKLDAAWQKWMQGWTGGDEPTFLSAAVAAGATFEESVHRWGRAVTNRRVGVACSGGGASAYRIAPILQRLHRMGIPVDVFAGLSGGALMGVFYCRQGLDGLQKLASLGPDIQRSMGQVIQSTQPFQDWVDDLLGHARVENLDVRLAAVTVALADDRPPVGSVVVKGTLGEAARVSGCLPPMFAPTEKNGKRFTDGGACALVPARVARDYGADILLAVNAIPTPGKTNPFEGWPAGELLRRLEPLGRLIDESAWRSYLMRQASVTSAREADQYIEFDHSQTSTLEPGLWYLAWEIMARASQEEGLDELLEEFARMWREMGT